MTKSLEPSGAPLSKIPTKIVFAGHENYLTKDQEEILLQFKEILIKDEYYFPTLGDKEKASHQDADLLRFLRARKFDLEGALSQFKSTEDWRKSEDVVKVYETFPVEEMKEAQGVYPQWTGRYDINGIPLYVFKVGALTKEATNAYAAAEDRIHARTIALYELMNQFVVPFANSQPRTHEDVPIVATSTIVDISGVSLSRFWSLRNHMSRVSELASAHYPETLGAIYIVGAPSFFSVVWGWIGKWFDKATVEKIFILSHHDALKTLSANIPIASIPEVYGGTLPFIYGETKPLLSEASQQILGLKEIPKGSLRWHSWGINEGELELLGVGRNEEEREEVRIGNLKGKKDEAVKVEEEKKEILEKVAIVENGHTEGKEKVTADSIPTDQPLEEVTVNSRLPPSIQSVEVISNGTEEKILVVEDEKHDIWTAARDEPGAPVKELAAVLDGTTL